MVSVRAGTLVYAAVTVLTFLPRTALSYPAYSLAPLALVRWRDWVPAQVPVLLFLTVAFAANAMTANVSGTVAVLEYALCFAFLLGAFGAGPDREWIDPTRLIRLFQVVIAATSLVSLIRMGFPLKLPYVHFLPDYYYATFGLGGARIVTLFGFVGIVCELRQRGLGGRARRGFLLLSVINFLMPNYLIGILAGVAGLSCYGLRRPVKSALALAVLTVLIGSYLSYRIETVSTVFAQVFGLHPKVYQFALIARMFDDAPLNLWIGGGIGQYGGQAALWTSHLTAELSSFTVPDLPGMFTPEYHERYLQTVMATFLQDIWAISSSSNKPYSSVSVMLAEFGLPFTALVLAMLVYRFVIAPRDLSMTAFGLFALTLMLVDRVHDLPWFGLLLIIANGLAVPQNRPATLLRLARAPV
ncbi:hypothetical protein [Psychromarinibacter sp. S121]|uniref:hypothetical protein n=1 Tax=Psychromarinibacter sp. S121 TaxID=3415127 RepID=UPI003C7D55E7